MAEVVSLSGAPEPSARIPQASLIAHLEDLLEQARSGELQGMGTVQMDHLGRAAWSASGLRGSFSLMGAAYCLLHELRAESRR